MLFNFDIHEGGSIAIDHRGIDLPDLEAARTEAAEAVADMGREIARKGDGAQISISVREEAGDVVHVASLTFKAGALEADLEQG